jgi:hypothetical protein
LRLYGEGGLPVRLEIQEDAPFSFSPVLFDGQAYYFGTRGRLAEPWLVASEEELSALFAGGMAPDLGEMLLWFWVLDPLTQLSVLIPTSDATSLPGGGRLVRGSVRGDMLLQRYPGRDPALLQEWSGTDWPVEVELDREGVPVVSRTTVFPGSSEEFVTQTEWTRAEAAPVVPQEAVPLEQARDELGF